MRSLLVGLLVAGAVAVGAPARRNRTIRLSLDGEHEEMLDAFALAGFRGNRSQAFSALLDLHSGRTLAELEELRAGALEPLEVEEWGPRRLTRDLIGRVARIVLDGNLPSTAFAALAVPEHQRRAWLKQGRADRLSGTASIHATLVAMIEQAQARSEIDRVARLEPDSAKWLLERQQPDTYGERRRVDTEHTHRLMPAIDWDRLNVGETRQLVELLRKASPTGDEARGELGAKARPALELLPGDVLEEDDEPEAPRPEARTLEEPAAELDPPEPAVDLDGPGGGAAVGHAGAELQKPEH